MADQKPLIEFEDRDSWQAEITSVRQYRPVETEVDSRGQSAAKREHLTSILGDAGTVGPWVERSQGWRPDNSGTSGPGPGSRGPDQPGGPVTSSEAWPGAGGEDRGYATIYVGQKCLPLKVDLDPTPMICNVDFSHLTRPKVNM